MADLGHIHTFQLKCPYFLSVSPPALKYCVLENPFKYILLLTLCHPRKPRASTGMGKEGRDWERDTRRGEGRGRERGSPGKLLYADHFSINYFSEPLLASFLIKFKMRPMKSDYMLIWKSLRTLELRTN